MDFSGVRLHGYHEWPFEQIAAVIEDAVRSGELRPHQQIPTEKDIQDLTGASRGTVRHAMDLLRQRGVIYTRAHLGSFIAERKPEALRRLQPPDLVADLFGGADEHPHSRYRITCLNNAVEERVRDHLAAEFRGEPGCCRPFPVSVHDLLRPVVPIQR